MLTVYSKSGVTAYSRHAESILHAVLTQEERARLTEALTRMDSSLTVEVVDPFRDPHIVPYEHVTLYLLDLIANTAQFSVKPARFRKPVALPAGLRTDASHQGTRPRAHRSGYRNCLRE